MSSSALSDLVQEVSDPSRGTSSKEVSSENMLNCFLSEIWGAQDICVSRAETTPSPADELLSKDIQDYTDEEVLLLAYIVAGVDVIQPEGSDFPDLITIDPKDVTTIKRELKKLPPVKGKSSSEVGFI